MVACLSMLHVYRIRPIGASRFFALGLFGAGCFFMRDLFFFLALSSFPFFLSLLPSFSFFFLFLLSSFFYLFLLSFLLSFLLILPSNPSFYSCLPFLSSLLFCLLFSPLPDSCFVFQRLCCFLSCFYLYWRSNKAVGQGGGNEPLVAFQCRPADGPVPILGWLFRGHFPLSSMI